MDTEDKNRSAKDGKTPSVSSIALQSLSLGSIFARQPEPSAFDTPAPAPVAPPPAVKATPVGAEPVNPAPPPAAPTPVAPAAAVKPSFSNVGWGADDSDDSSDPEANDDGAATSSAYAIALPLDNEDLPHMPSQAVSVEEPASTTPEPAIVAERAPVEPVSVAEPVDEAEPEADSVELDDAPDALHAAAAIEPSVDDDAAILDETVTAETFAPLEVELSAEAYRQADLDAAFNIEMVSEPSDDAPLVVASVEPTDLDAPHFLPPEAEADVAPEASDVPVRDAIEEPEVAPWSVADVDHTAWAADDHDVVPTHVDMVETPPEPVIEPSAPDVVTTAFTEEDPDVVAADKIFPPNHPPSETAYEPYDIAQNAEDYNRKAYLASYIEDYQPDGADSNWYSAHPDDVEAMDDVYQVRQPEETVDAGAPIAPADEDIAGFDNQADEITNPSAFEPVFAPEAFEPGDDHLLHVPSATHSFDIEAEAPVEFGSIENEAFEPVTSVEAPHLADPVEPFIVAADDQDDYQPEPLYSAEDVASESFASSEPETAYVAHETIIQESAPLDLTPAAAVVIDEPESGYASLDSFSAAAEPFGFQPEVAAPEIAASEIAHSDVFSSDPIDNAIEPSFATDHAGFAQVEEPDSYQENEYTAGLFGAPSPSHVDLSHVEAPAPFMMPGLEPVNLAPSIQAEHEAAYAESAIESDAVAYQGSAFEANEPHGDDSSVHFDWANAHREEFEQHAAEAASEFHDESLLVPPVPAQQSEEDIWATAVSSHDPFGVTPFGADFSMPATHGAADNHDLFKPESDPVESSFDPFGHPFGGPFGQQSDNVFGSPLGQGFGGEANYQQPAPTPDPSAGNVGDETGITFQFNNAGASVTTISFDEVDEAPTIPLAPNFGSAPVPAPQQEAPKSSVAAPQTSVGRAGQNPSAPPEKAGADKPAPANASFAPPGFYEPTEMFEDDVDVKASADDERAFAEAIPDAKPRKAAKEDRAKPAKKKGLWPQRLSRLMMVGLALVIVGGGIAGTWIGYGVGGALRGEIAAPIVTLYAAQDGHVTDISAAAGAQLSAGNDIMTIRGEHADEVVRNDLSARLQAAQDRMAKLDNQAGSLGRLADDIRGQHQDAFYKSQISEVQQRIADVKSQRDAAAAEAQQLRRALTDEEARLAGAAPQNVAADRPSLLRQLLVSLGMSVKLGTPVAELSDCSHMYVTPRDTDLTPGSMVMVRLDNRHGALPGEVQYQSTTESASDSSPSAAGPKRLVISVNSTALQRESGELCPVGRGVTILPVQVNHRMAGL